MLASKNRGRMALGISFAMAGDIRDIDSGTPRSREDAGLTFEGEDMFESMVDVGIDQRVLKAISELAVQLSTSMALTS